MSSLDTSLLVILFVCVGIALLSTAGLVILRQVRNRRRRQQQQQAMFSLPTHKNQTPQQPQSQSLSPSPSARQSRHHHRRSSSVSLRGPPVYMPNPSIPVSEKQSQTVTAIRPVSPLPEIHIQSPEDVERMTSSSGVGARNACLEQQQVGDVLPPYTATVGDRQT